MSDERDRNERIHAVLADVDHTQPSTTKYSGLNALLPSLIGVPEATVYSAYASKPGNVKVRAEQAKRSADVFGVVVDEDTSYSVGDERLHRYVRPAKTYIVGPGRNFRAAVYIAQDESDHHWTVKWVVGDEVDPVVIKIREAFPSATLWKPEVTLHIPAVRGPALDLPEIEIELDDRVMRMVRVAVASAPAVILVGPPGTGKTRMIDQVIREAQANPESFGLSKPPAVKRATPEESWTTRELVGGETVDDEGRLRFRPGHVLDAIREDSWLFLDEINRADMDKIFGGLLTWLSDEEVELARASTAVAAPPVALGWAEGNDCDTENVDRLEEKDAGAEPIRFLAGRDWRVVGTYNAIDAQRVFRFGQALGRRFVRVPIPPMQPEAFARVLGPQIDDLPAQVGAALVAAYTAHFNSDVQLGPAVFFRAHSYVRSALELTGISGVDSDRLDDDDVLSPVIAEAYLLAVGSWLARLAPEERDSLGVRIVTGGALSQAQWDWVQSLVPALG